MRCRQAKTLIVKYARGATQEAERVSLDAHLEGCADCRKEHGHWLLLERLGRQPAPGLSAEAQRQMLQRLIRQAQSASKPESARRPTRYWPWAMSICAAAAVLALLVFRLDRSRAPLSIPASPVQLAASADGAVEMTGAWVTYLSGTALRIDDARREVVLEKGQVDVDVIPAKPRVGSRFRVLTARFVVEVLGTRFRVTPESVVTLRGRVRVLDLDGKELATLGAGERWQLTPTHTATAAAPVETSAQTPPAQMPTVQPSSAQSAPAQSAPAQAPTVQTPSTPTQPVETPRAMVAPPVVHPPRTVADSDVRRPVALTVRQKLALARSALADGNQQLARQKIADAWKSEPSPAQRAALALLEADCLLSERRYPEAIAAYRSVSRQYPDDASGETAAFALAQFLSERGNQAEARAALEAYLARYPSGRFVREVQEKLRPRDATP